MITVDRIRQETGITDTDLLTDSLIQDFIDEETYRAQVEFKLNLSSTPADTYYVEEVLDGNNKPYLFLRNLNISGIESVTVDDTEIPLKDIKIYDTIGAIYYSEGFNAGVQNVVVKYYYRDAKYALITAIIRDRVCIRCFTAYGAVVSEGATEEKFGSYTIKFKNKPYDQIIQEYKSRIEKHLNLLRSTVSFEAV